MTMLSYGEAQDTLLRYVHDAGVLFADRFSRWPVQGQAYEIVKILEARIPYYEQYEQYEQATIACKLHRIHAILKARICKGD